MKFTPSLVVAIEQKKIREYSKDEKETENGNIITWIMSLLGIISTDDNSRTLHYVAVDDFISDDLGKYSYAEIKEAFKMYVKGDFNSEFERLIYKLDCIILAKVMRCYDVVKQSQTNAYYSELKKKVRELHEMKNQITEEQKIKIIMSGLESAFYQYHDNGTLDIGRLYLYDFLYEKDLLPKEKVTKEAVLKIAIKNIEKQRSNATTKRERDYLNIFNKDNTYSVNVINECKRISVLRCFDQFSKYEQLLAKVNR